jgi:hypothetical protein
MRSATGRLAVFLLLFACARPAVQEPAPATGAGARVDRTMITKSMLGDHRFTTAYEAVESLRSNWLNTRGPDSFNNPSKVRVYFDNGSLGGVETLKSIGVIEVMYLRFFDGISATARWGLDHGSGVIYVSTRPANTDP